MAFQDQAEHAKQNVVSQQGFVENTNLEEIEQIIMQRYSKRTGSFEKFLMEWIKLDESQDLLFKNIGKKQETLFQYVLARGNSEFALAIAKVCEFFADTIESEKIVQFMGKKDEEGNDIWHYLAHLLMNSENDHGIQIAKILLKLEISYIRKNKKDETALGMLLFPEVKWRSVNSIYVSKEITIDDLEKAFSDNIIRNKKIKEEVFVSIFFSDLKNNDAFITENIVNKCIKSQSEKKDRLKALALVFGMRGTKKKDTLFSRIIEIDNKKLFEKCIDLLLVTVQEQTLSIEAHDLQKANAERQRLIYRLTSQVNSLGQTPLMRAMIADKAIYVSMLCGLLKNENMMITYKDNAEQRVEIPIIVDKDSPAPQNAALSVLLKQDSRGNTAFHIGVFLSRVDCMRRLLNGLSFMDSYMILTKVPNNIGIVPVDFLDPKKVGHKVSRALHAGQIASDEARHIVKLSRELNRSLYEDLQDVLKRAQATIERTGGLSEAKPTFDLLRIPTVVASLKSKDSSSGPEKVIAKTVPKSAVTSRPQEPIMSASSMEEGKDAWI